MIIGLLLGLSIAVALASAGIIITGLTGALQENIVTGAVIGTTGAISYAVITLIISLVAAFFLSLVLKNPSR